MDTLIGLITAFGALTAALLLEGGRPSELWGPSAFLIVMGGVIGALFISFPIAEVAKIPKLIALAFRKQNTRYEEKIATVVNMSEKARRDGILSLEPELAKIDDDFLRRAFSMVVDGTDPDMLKNMLEIEITSVEQRHEAGAAMFEAAGGFAPTMGIIGTVMGLVKVLSSITDTASLAKNIAVAFIATFYGVATANLFWLPIASKLKVKSKAEILEMELAMEGALSVQAGENPHALEQKLNAFLPPSKRSSKWGAATAAAGETDRA